MVNGARLSLAAFPRLRKIAPRTTIQTSRLRELAARVSAVRQATSDSALPVGACSAASDATRQRDRRFHQLEMQGVNVRGEGKEEPIRAAQTDFSKRPIREGNEVGT